MGSERVASQRKIGALVKDGQLLPRNRAAAALPALAPELLLWGLATLVPLNAIYVTLESVPPVAA